MQLLRVHLMQGIGLVLAVSTAAGQTPALAAQQKDNKAASASNGPPEWLREKIEAKNSHYKTFPSQTVGQKVSYFIYLPSAYEQKPDARFPVTYWLHGLSRGQAGIPKLVERFDSAIEAGKLPPMLIVFVNGMHNSFYCDSADGKMPVETVIVKDLVPHIDATYRTVAKREGRIIEGFSMGGFGAAHLGFRYPELFGTVSIIDGALPDLDSMRNKQADLYQRIFGGSEQRFQAEHPLAIVEKNAGEIRGRTTIRLAFGFNVDGNRALHELLTKLKIEHDYDTFRDIPHSPLPIYEGLREKNWRFYERAFNR